MILTDFTLAQLANDLATYIYNMSYNGAKFSSLPPMFRTLYTSATINVCWWGSPRVYANWTINESTAISNNASLNSVLASVQDALKKVNSNLNTKIDDNNLQATYNAIIDFLENNVCLATSMFTSAKYPIFISNAKANINPSTVNIRASDMINTIDTHLIYSRARNKHKLYVVKYTPHYWKVNV